MVQIEEKTAQAMGTPLPPSYQPVPGGQPPFPQPMYPQQPPLMQAAPANPADIGQQYQQQLFARCAQGNHDPHTKYGVCGIITAIVCFPIGLICLFTDSEQRCVRCGVKL